jgi:hypothetical protein
MKVALERRTMSRTLIYHTHVSIDGNVTVETDSGACIEAQFDSISKSGLILHCDQHSLKILFPVTPSLSPKQTVQLDVDFGLPGVGRITARCDVTSLRRMSRTKFELQMIFAEADLRTLYALEHYVERKLKESNPSMGAKDPSNNVHPLSNAQDDAQQNEDEVKRVA